MALESKTAEQKLQKMEDSRRKNEKMAKQVEKVWPVQFIVMQKNIFWYSQTSVICTFMGIFFITVYEGLLLWYYWL